MSKLKEIEENVTCYELISEICVCMKALYNVDCGNGVYRLHPELRNFSGILSVIDQQSNLLFKKLENHKDIK